MERDEIIARRSLRARRYEEDEKEDDKAENLIDTMEVADIVDKAVDALKGYDCPEKEYDDEEKENLPESESRLFGISRYDNLYFDDLTIKIFI